MSVHEDPVERAVDLLIKANRHSAKRLRRLGQAPYGLVPNPNLPRPAAIGSETLDLSIRNVIRAKLSGTPIPDSSIILRYGNVSPQSGSFIEVITDFSRGHRDSGSLEDELQAVIRESAIAPTDLPLSQSLEESIGPIVHDTCGILVDGESRILPRLRYRRFSVFRFGARGRLVTVVGRDMNIDLMDFKPVTDFEPFVGNIDSMDRDTLRNVVRAQLRQSVDRPWNQVLYLPQSRASFTTRDKPCADVDRVREALHRSSRRWTAGNMIAYV